MQLRVLCSKYAKYAQKYCSNPNRGHIRQLVNLDSRKNMLMLRNPSPDHN